MTATITVTDLYNTDHRVRAFVDEWVAHRWCPMPFADLLEELGLESASRCARWCYEQPARRVFHPYTPGGERDGVCHPYPTMNTVISQKEQGYGWYWDVWGDKSGYAHEIPSEMMSRSHRTLTLHPTEALAIRWLLDHWR